MRASLVATPARVFARRVTGRSGPRALLVGRMPVKLSGSGCEPSACYVRQFRFDEDGWNKIIDLMKVVPNNGVYPANPKPNAIIDFDRKELAAYLARASP
ncbi:MAG: hypothetical protein WBW74_08160 [Xanthobacteraceae bacterium]